MILRSNHMIIRITSVDVARNRMTDTIMLYVRGDCQYTNHDAYILPILQMWDMFNFQWPRST